MITVYFIFWGFEKSWGILLGKPYVSVLFETRAKSK